MSDCPSRYKLVRLEAGLLEGSELRILTQHLDSCARCAKNLDELRGNAMEFDAKSEDQLAILKQTIIAGESALDTGNENDNPVSSLEWFRNHKRTTFAAAASLAAAAAIALILVSSPTRLTPLPPYELETSSGNLRLRGEDKPNQTMSLPNGTKLRFVARPIDAIRGAFEARAFAVTDDDAVELPIPLEIDESGAVSLTASIGEDLILPKRTRSIWLAIARPGKLPNAENLRTHIENISNGAPSSDFVLLGKNVELEPR